MGILDKKERIFDIVLTDRGRKLLSQNQLVVKYYAFSDDGVNYSSSFVNGSISGSSVDGEVYKTFLFEASQKNDRSKNLNHFLYTIPNRGSVLPEVVVGVASITSSIELERRFHTEILTLETTPKTFSKKPIDVIVRAKVEVKTIQDREREYVDGQRVAQALKIISSNKK